MFHLAPLKNFCQPVFHFSRQAGCGLAADGMHVKNTVLNADGDGARGQGYGVGQGDLCYITFQFCFKGDDGRIYLVQYIRMQCQEGNMQR
jgi:hypothetical protein